MRVLNDFTERKVHEFGDFSTSSDIFARFRLLISYPSAPFEAVNGAKEKLDVECLVVYGLVTTSIEAIFAICEPTCY